MFQYGAQFYARPTKKVSQNFNYFSLQTLSVSNEKYMKKLIIHLQNERYLSFFASAVLKITKFLKKYI